MPKLEVPTKRPEWKPAGEEFIVGQRTGIHVRCLYQSEYIFCRLFWRELSMDERSKQYSESAATEWASKAIAKAVAEEKAGA